MADSYLDHIRIAIEAGDEGAPFRDFVDNWAAYASEEDHHRTTGYRVIWFNNPDVTARRAMLLSLPFRSLAADKVLQYAVDHPGSYRERHRAKDATVRLIVDHAVPLAVIVRQLFRPEADLSRVGISRHLERWYCLGLLTSAEDAILTSRGLRSAMPADWDGTDVLARYRIAGIPAASTPKT